MSTKCEKCYSTDPCHEERGLICLERQLAQSQERIAELEAELREADERERCLRLSNAIRMDDVQAKGYGGASIPMTNRKGQTGAEAAQAEENKNDT